MASIHSDLQNLLDYTETATVFVDAKLTVQRFTGHATRVFRLIAEDLRRPFFDIAAGLQYPDLQGDVSKALRALVVVEKPIPSLAGRWCRSRIMRYRAAENGIDGVVLKFSDTTDLNAPESGLCKLHIKRCSSKF